jgi:protein phosphatase
VEALRRAHDLIRSTNASGSREMGTTLAALVLVDGPTAARWLMINIGDSRVYRLLNGRLEQLSVDHSIVQEMLAAGQLTEEAARTHPERHVITRAVGIGDEIVADYSLLDPEPGERFLLCSDGVHSQLDIEQLQDLVSRQADPQTVAAALVSSVLKGRAPDNATAVVVDVLGSDTTFGGLEADTSPRDRLATPDPGEADDYDSEGTADDPASKPAGMITVPSW